MKKRIALFLALVMLVGLISVPAAVAAPTASYTVEHRLESLQGEFELRLSEPLSGEVGDFTQADARVYEGFTAQPFTQQRITSDGRTTVVIRYARNSYMLMWSTDGDALRGSYTTGSLPYGSAVQAPETPTKLGYTFAGWSSEVAATMPAAYTVYTAQWNPNEDTPYTVYHYLRDLSGSGYTLTETENLTGTTGAYTAIVAKPITGFSSLPFRQETIAPDGSTTVRVYYDRDRFTLIWDGTDGVLKGNYTSGSVLFGTPIVRPAVERNGYNFKGWNAEPAETMPAAFTVYTAQWTARPFTIRYALGGGYLPGGAVNPESYTEETPSFALVAPVREGYTFVGWIGTGLTEPTAHVTVLTSRKLDLSFSAVWDANRYNVVCHPNGGAVNSGAVRAYTAGVGATLPTDVTRDGYIFEGWYDNEGLTGSPISGIGTGDYGDKEFWAKWTERPGSAYTVRHYLQAKNGSGYTLAETETLSGQAGTQTAAAAKQFLGFTARAFSQAQILGDGGTVVDIYYDRNFFNLIWDPQGGTLSGEYSLGPTRYGGDIVSPLVSRPEHRFDGWFLDPECTIPWDGGSEITDPELTLYARWIRNDELHRVRVKVLAGSLEGETVTNATVELRRGGTTYRSLICRDGLYSADDVPDGDYTVLAIAPGRTTTATAALRVEGADPAVLYIVLPFGSVSTEVEIGPGTPAATVDGMEDVAGDEEIMGTPVLGQTVVLKLAFELSEDLSRAEDANLSEAKRSEEAAQARIRAEAARAVTGTPDLTYYSIRLLKITTDSYGDSVTEPILDIGSHVLTVTIPYGTGTQELHILRDHVANGGSATTAELVPVASRDGAHSDGTCFLGDSAIDIYSSKFSIVGLAKPGDNNGTGGIPDGDDPTGGGPSDPGTYDPNSGGNGGDPNGGDPNSGGNGGGNGGDPNGGGGNGGDPNGGGGTVYIDGRTSRAIKVLPSTGGSVKPSATSAYPGDTVTLKVTPDTGYVLNSLSVVDSNGKTVPVSVQGSGVYFFIMPDSAVTVSSDFLSDLERFGNTGVANRLITDNHIIFIRGFEDGSVRPYGNITRAEVAMIFYRLLRSSEGVFNNSFIDVAPNMWYTNAILTLAGLGIVNGYKDGSFRPDRNITRAEFTAIACRFGNMIDSGLRFTDVPDDHWARRYISCAAGFGWVEGYGDGSFGPGDFMTRAQAVAIVNRMLHRIPDQSYIRAHRAELVSFTDMKDESAWYYFHICEATNAHAFVIEQGAEHWNP